MDVGLVSLGDNLPHPHTGERLSPRERFRQLVDLGALAEELGFWSFHLGEHHFSEYILSSPRPSSPPSPSAPRGCASRPPSPSFPTTMPSVSRRTTPPSTCSPADAPSLSVAAASTAPTYAQFGQDQERSAEMLSESVELLRRLWTEEGVSWSRLLPAAARSRHRSPPARPATPPADLALCQLPRVRRPRRRTRLPHRHPHRVRRGRRAPRPRRALPRGLATGRARSRGRPRRPPRPLPRRRRLDRRDRRVLAPLPDRLPLLGPP